MFGIYSLIFLVVGFFILIKGADYLVDGASSFAKRMGVSAIVIGLTIVSFGTSAPELIVNIFASVQGNTDIAIGNILGSNIANIFLILGISAIIFPLAVKSGTVWKEIPLSLLAALTLGIMANDILIDKSNFSGLTKIDGIIFIFFFIIFIYYTFSIGKVQPADKEQVPIKLLSLPRSLLKIITGLMGLVLGGKLIVDSAVNIAQSMGVSEALIGLTIVAVGTSLPELAASAVAAYRKDVDIAVGNVVGSNIFNIFWILGVSSIINPLPFSSLLMKDVMVTIFATFLLFIFMFIGKRHILERWQGCLFIVLYIIYIAVLIAQEALR